MFDIKIVNRNNEDEVLNTRNFGQDSVGAEKYFNLLKTDYATRKDEYYDKDKEIKYSDIKVNLLQDDKIINYFMVG